MCEGFLCGGAVSDVHRDPAARGWLFQVDVEQSRAVCFQPVRAAFLNKALFVFRAHSLEPSEERDEIRPIRPPRRAPASELRCVSVCVRERLRMSYLVF